MATNPTGPLGINVGGTSVQFQNYTPAQLAAAYAQWIAQNGGDTEANQQAAKNYLMSQGVSPQAIEQAHGIYKTQIGGQTTGPAAPTPIAASVFAKPRPVTQPVGGGVSRNQPGVIQNPVIRNAQQRDAKRAEMDARAAELRAKGPGGLTREESQWLSDYSKSTARVDAIAANGGFRAATPEQKANWAAKNPERAEDFEYLGAGRTAYKPGRSPQEQAAAAQSAQDAASQEAYARQQAERGYQNIGQLFGSGMNALWDSQGNRNRNWNTPVPDLYKVPEGQKQSFLGAALDAINKYDPDGKYNTLGDLDWKGKIAEYDQWHKSGMKTPWYEKPAASTGGAGVPLSPKPAGGVIAEKISPPSPQVAPGQAGPLGTRQSGIINERMKDSTRWR